jgi:hypothetical protein
LYVAAGQPFTATLVCPPNLPPPGTMFGARIEVPVSRAVVGMWTQAALDDTELSWTVTMIAPPTQPLTRYGMWTTPWIQAALDAGEFELVWADSGAIAAAEIFVPLFTYPDGSSGTPPPTPEDWPFPDIPSCTPSVDDVALLERTRTYADGDTEYVTFNDDTRPTGTEVLAIIAQAVPVVLAQFRPTFPDTLYDEVAHCVALYTAILIEGSYFREQLNEGAVQLYSSLFTQAVAGVNAQIATALEQALSGANGAMRLT